MRRLFIFVVALLFATAGGDVAAQSFLKNLGKSIGKQITNTVTKKTTEAVNKGVEKGIDKAVEKAESNARERQQQKAQEQAAREAEAEAEAQAAQSQYEQPVDDGLLPASSDGPEVEEQVVTPIAPIAQTAPSKPAQTAKSAQVSAKAAATSVSGSSVSSSGKLDGYEYVDLGLPSGLKWATRNVGASSISDCGKHYAWGEVATKEKYSKANGKLNGQKFDEIGGKAQYDAARAIWGGSWRLPTMAEFEELQANSNWEWTTLDGVNGYLVSSKINGKSIFLPAAGCTDGEQADFVGQCGLYWTSTSKVTSPLYASYIAFGGNQQTLASNLRYIGQSIRPVSGANKLLDAPRQGKINGHEWIDLGLPSGTKWSTCNVGATAPEQPGKYFWWGDISPRTSFTAENCKRAVKTNISGDPKYDAAAALWGGGWRIATKEEWDEMIRYCDRKYEKLNGRWGERYTSTINNNSIFIPVTGYYDGSKLSNSSGNGYYWIGTYYYFYQFGAALGEVSGSHRDPAADRIYPMGYAVRAVCK